jgi:hypothetical protein
MGQINQNITDNYLTLYHKLIMVIFGTILFLISLYLTDNYAYDDLKLYNLSYEQISNLNLLEAYAIYFLIIGSFEPVHFFLTWIASNVGLDRNLFVGICNLLLFTSFFQLCRSYRVNTLVILFVCFSSFYFWILFLELERLKLSFVFLFYAGLMSRNNGKYQLIFYLLAVITHLQSSFILLGIFCFYKRDYIFRLFKGYLNYYLILIILLIVGVFSLLSTHIYYKLISYLGGLFFIDFLKMLIFPIISFIYKKSIFQVLVIFLPTLLAVIVLGGGRLNIIAYFLTLLFILPISQGFNIATLALSMYFMIKNYLFLSDYFS